MEVTVLSAPTYSLTLSQTEAEDLLHLVNKVSIIPGCGRAGCFYHTLINAGINLRPEHKV